MPPCQFLKGEYRINIGSLQENNFDDSCRRAELLGEFTGP